MPEKRQAGDHGELTICAAPTKFAFPFSLSLYFPVFPVPPVVLIPEGMSENYREFSEKTAVCCRTAASIMMKAHDFPMEFAMNAATLRAVVTQVRRLAEGNPRLQSDRHLLERFTKQRDELAFTELVRRHGPMVLTTCRRVLRHAEDAEDAFQAAFLVLARKASSIRDQDSIVGWLYRVAHRLALRAKCDSDRRRSQLADFGRTRTLNRADSPGATAQAVLADEIDRLPDAYRSAIVLCYLEGRSQNEAARLLATTEDAVNSRLKRARDLLRQRLSRHGLTLSAAAIAQALAAGFSDAAVSSTLMQHTAQTALAFATNQTMAGSVSPLAVSLAKGAIHAMTISNQKSSYSHVGALLFLAAGALFMMPIASGDHPAQAPGNDRALTLRAKPLDQPAGKMKQPLHCIILWMSGGPSQNDTFDPKPGKVALFKAIDTNVPGVQFSETFPKLAKQADKLAIIRSMTHRTGDHTRGSYLMRTGHEPGPNVDMPSLGSVLAKELGDDRAELPRFFTIGSSVLGFGGAGPAFLGKQYGPISVGASGFGVAPQPGDPLPLPAVEAFETVAQGRGEAHRKAVAKAFDLKDEKAEVRDAYGKSRFGTSCLLASRLVDAGVPVVEVISTGWDMHSNAVVMSQKINPELDAAFAALLEDLQDRKKLEHTVIVWMGEFGRTPRINQSGGRDHYPQAFTAVLAGRGVKGGQAIGKTSNDGVRVEERPVSPPELLATIYTALGIDPGKTNRTAGGVNLPLVEKGHSAVKEALR